MFQLLFEVNLQTTNQKLVFIEIANQKRVFTFMSGDNVGDSLDKVLSTDLFLSDFDLESVGNVEKCLSSVSLIGSDIFFFTFL